MAHTSVVILPDIPVFIVDERLRSVTLGQQSIHIDSAVELQSMKVRFLNAFVWCVRHLDNDGLEALSSTLPCSSRPSQGLRLRRHVRFQCRESRMS